jgi:PhnB protein
VARTSTYLNFMGNTKEAFTFYKSVFGGEFTSAIQYMKDVPPMPGQPELAEDERDMVMHVELVITGGHVIMGTDMLKSLGHELHIGNNMSINLEPDTREETDKLFAALSDGASDIIPLTEMFWGGYFGVLLDKFGIRWMFNCDQK